MMLRTDWLVIADTFITLAGVLIAVDAWRKAASALTVANDAHKLAYSKIDPRDPAITKADAA